MIERQRFGAFDRARLHRQQFEIFRRDRAVAAADRVRRALLRFIECFFVAAAVRRQ